jgi:hydrogenase maturation protease
MASLSGHRAVLVVGCGNELRGDDGLGPAVVKAVASLGLPQVKCVALHQLLPELAEQLAEADLAVFVDARIRPGGQAVQATRVEPAESAGVMAHAADPRALLALAREVYGRAPEAWLVAVAGHDFDWGERLSPAAVENVRLARGWIAGLIRSGLLPEQARQQ